MHRASRHPRIDNRRIQHRARMATLALMLGAACRPAEPSTPLLVVDNAVVAEAGADVILAPGETAEIASINLRVRFNRVIGDSRCPTKSLIMCVWAGSVVVEVQGGPITGRQFIETRRLETVVGRDTAATIAGQPVRLLRVTPEKETTDEVPAATYRIVLQAGSKK